jgi:hypothetical protein
LLKTTFAFEVAPVGTANLKTNSTDFLALDGILRLPPIRPDYGKMLN